MLAFSNSDWGQESQSQKSVSGNFMTPAGSSVLWNSKQQSIIAQSSMEAEFVSLEGWLKEVLCLKNFSSIIDKVLDKPTVESLFKNVIGEDNQVCISNAKTVVISGYS